MSASVYKGSVVLHPDYVALQREYPELVAFTKAFKTYWLQGYHPMIGRDGILPHPDIYAQSAIGRAHVEPPVKDPQSYSSSVECWSAWRSVAMTEGGDITVPTSDTFLMYCVDHLRNACLIGYLDGDGRGGHSALNSNGFRLTMSVRAGSFFSRTPKASPMPIEEHKGLFGESWLVSQNY